MSETEKEETQHGGKPNDNYYIMSICLGEEAVNKFLNSHHETHGLETIVPVHGYNSPAFLVVMSECYEDDSTYSLTDKGANELNSASQPADPAKAALDHSPDPLASKKDALDDPSLLLTE